MSETSKKTSEPAKTTQINSLVDQLTSYKREIFAYLDQALSLDAHNQHNESIILYRKCMTLTRKVFEFVAQQVDRFQKTPDVVKIHSDLSKIYEQTKERLLVLEQQQRHQETSKIDDAATSQFADMSDEILNYADQDSNQIIYSADANATELFKIENNVQIFYIGNDGSVSTPSNPITLSIYSFNDPCSVAKGFIKVGTWMYPLNPNRTPILKTVYNAYLFPNEFQGDEQIKCSNIGIMFTDDVHDQVRHLFDDILGNFGKVLVQTGTESVQTVVRNTASQQERERNEEQIRESLRRELVDNDNDKDAEKKKQLDETDESCEKTGAAERISRTLVSSARLISKGVNMTTEYANKFIQTGSDKIKAQAQPNLQPTSIDPKLHKCVEGIRYGSNVTVKVSSFLVNKLGQLASSTAQTIAPMIKSTSTKLLSQTGIAQTPDSAAKYMENVCQVASSSMASYAIVYESLETAAQSLAKNLAQQSVHVIQHKYGTDASRLADNAISSAGNVAMATYNIQGLKVTKTIAKATAKETIRTFAHANDQDCPQEPSTNNFKSSEIKK